MKKKTILIVVAVILGLAIIGNLLEDPKEKEAREKANSEQSENKNLNNTTNNNLTTSAKDDSIQVRLKREIKGAKEKEIQKADYYQNMQMVMIEMALYKVWGTYIEEAQQSNNVEIQTLGKQLEKEVKRVQSIEFPILRQAYNNIAQQKLNSSNSNVSTGLSNNGLVLNVYSLVFISEELIRNVHQSIGDVAKELRFKRINYQVSPSNNKGGYYDLESLNDTDITTTKSNEAL